MDKDFEWWATTFRTAVQDIGETVIFLSPWNDPVMLKRAWCLYEMGKALENNAMIAAANEHFDFSYEKIDNGEYAGEHWLASFAAYALEKAG